jgi:hypothetical protein
MHRSLAPKFLVATASVVAFAGCPSSGGSPGSALSDGGPRSSGSSSSSGFSSGTSNESGPASSSGGDSGTDEAAAAVTVGCTPDIGACDCISESFGTTPEGSCPGPTMPNPVCCAELGYPSGDLTTCQCRNYACADTGQGCTCAFDSTAVATGASCPSTYAYCCEDVSLGQVQSCTCSDQPCASGATLVTSCSTGVFNCQAAFDVQLPSCR